MAAVKKLTVKADTDLFDQFLNLAEGPILHRLAHQGQNVVSPAFQPPDIVPELPHPALHTDLFDQFLNLAEGGGAHEDH